MSNYTLQDVFDISVQHMRDTGYIDGSLYFDPMSGCPQCVKGKLLAVLSEFHSYRENGDVYAHRLYFKWQQKPGSRIEKTVKCLADHLEAIYEGWNTASKFAVDNKQGCAHVYSWEQSLEMLAGAYGLKYTAPAKIISKQKELEAV